MPGDAAAGGLVLGVDPGNTKAGFAVVSADGTVVTAGVLRVSELRTRIEALIRMHRIGTLALGRGTNAAGVRAELSGLALPIELIDEYETSRRARELYFSEHPPSGWRRLIPLGLQVPPRAVDDYAAILIARRFLARETRQESPR